MVFSAFTCTLTIQHSSHGNEHSREKCYVIYNRDNIWHRPSSTLRHAPHFSSVNSWENCNTTESNIHSKYYWKSGIITGKTVYLITSIKISFLVRVSINILHVVCVCARACVMVTLTGNDYSSIPSQAHKHHRSCHMMASYSKITRYLKTAFLWHTYCYPMTSTSHKAQRTQLKTAQKSRVCLCGLPAGEPQTCFTIIATFPPGIKVQGLQWMVLKPGSVTFPFLRRLFSDPELMRWMSIFS